MSAKPILVAASAALLLAACSSMTVVAPPYYGRYAASDFQWAAGNRDLLVEVRGNPSTLPDAAFKQAVVDAMQGKKPGVQTHFTLTPGPSARPGYRVVLLFDAPEAARGPASCAPQPPPITVSDPRGRAVSMMATFCSGNEAMSDLSASAPPLAADPRPQLESLMGVAIPALLPIESPLLRRSSDDMRR